MRFSDDIPYGQVVGGGEDEEASRGEKTVRFAQPGVGRGEAVGAVEEEDDVVGAGGETGILHARRRRSVS